MSNHLILFLGGLASFYIVYFITKEIVSTFCHKTLSESDICDISVKCVSLLMGLLSTYCGLIIITSVTDIMYDQHWLTDASVWFGTPYFIYDTWAMYQPFYLDHPELHHKPFRERVKDYVKSQPLMTFHHIVLPVIFFPCAAILRNGKGDFFVGCFYFFELAIPFIASRNIIIRLKLKNTWLYVVNGIVMIVVFFLSRVAIFPFMFWQYAKYKDVMIWQVPSHIPMKCTIGCAVLLSLMLYWMTVMVKVAIKTVRKLREPLRKKECAVSNGSSSKNGLVKIT